MKLSPACGRHAHRAATFHDDLANGAIGTDLDALASRHLFRRHRLGDGAHATDGMAPGTLDPVALAEHVMQQHVGRARRCSRLRQLPTMESKPSTALIGSLSNQPSSQSPADWVNSASRSRRAVRSSVDRCRPSAALFVGAATPLSTHRLSGWVASAAWLAPSTSRDGLQPRRMRADPRRVGTKNTAISRGLVPAR